jgi:nicotinate-nucleotide adenylyltransferase
MAKIAFYGGTFDPVHNGHLTVANALVKQFSLDSFAFIPAFHAPHKKRLKPTSAFDRHAMLCLATEHDASLSVSKIEVELPERPYTVETLRRLNEALPNDEIFFVMGADSWRDITTWRDWETVLTIADHLVVTRPGFSLETEHVGPRIKDLIVDVRGRSTVELINKRRIYFTDAVRMDVSATSIRGRIREGDDSWRRDVPKSVAKYIEKYQIYS